MPEIRKTKVEERNYQNPVSNQSRMSSAAAARNLNGAQKISSLVSRAVECIAPEFEMAKKKKKLTKKYVIPRYASQIPEDMTPEKGSNSLILISVVNEWPFDLPCVLFNANLMFFLHDIIPFCLFVTFYYFSSRQPCVNYITLQFTRNLRQI